APGAARKATDQEEHRDEARMRAGMRRKLTYANVVSTLCLFLLLTGGAAFAAGQLAKNSVGSKQLRKNAVTTAKLKSEAVTGAKVKKGTLTGTQIDASTLSTVPSASDALTLDGRSADQLTNASKLHCPSGTKLYSGTCFEETEHAAASWSAAA